MDDSFSLGALLRLGLHHHVEACSEIVDRAEKELVIENALRKIEDAWGGLALAFAPHQVCCPCWAAQTYLRRQQELLLLRAA